MDTSLINKADVDSTEDVSYIEHDSTNNLLQTPSIVVQSEELDESLDQQGINHSPSDSTQVELDSDTSHVKVPNKK